MIKHWEILVGALALAAGLWSHIKAVFAWLRGLLIVTSWIDDDAMRLLCGYLAASAKAFGRPAYMVHNYYVRPLGRSAPVPVEDRRWTGGLFWFRGRPIRMLRPDKPLVEHVIEYQLQVLRGSVSVQQLLCTAADWAVATVRESRDRFKVIYHHGRSLAGLGNDSEAPPTIKGPRWDPRAGKLLQWTPEDLNGSDGADTIDALALMPPIVAVTEEIRSWYNDRKWHKSKGIPWRLGLLYAGPPGTGKTSHVRAVAAELDLPVHVFDLASMSNEDLRKAWEAMAASAPCVALIEDIDRVFDGDKNIAPASGLMGSGGLTFDALLNAIDGVERHDGVLLVVTTNHLDRIDPALKDRRGRIDQVVHFPALDMQRRAALAKRILEDDALAFQVAIEAGDTPASKFADRCCRIALACRRGMRIGDALSIYR